MFKKRLFRRLLIFAALMVVLFVVALAVLFNSSVQRSIVLHYLQAVDSNAKLESVSLGLSEGDLKGLELKTGGSLIKVQHATLKYSLGNIIFGGVRVIEDAQVTGLDLDSTQASEAAGGAIVVAAPRQNNPPMALLVKNAKISGTVHLSENHAAQLSIEGKNFGAGSNGEATGQLDYLDNSATAKVSQMHADLKLSLACDAAMRPQALDVTADSSATIPGQTAPARLLVHLQAQAQNADAGNYSLVLEKPGATGATPAQLLMLKGSYASAGTAQGDFNADLTRTQIEPFVLGYPLPDFDVHGQGQLSLDAAAASLSMKGALQGHAGHLEAVQPNLIALGNMQFSANVDFTCTKQQLASRSLVITLAPQGSDTAVKLELLKPFTLEFSKDAGAKLTQGAGEELAQLTLTQVPTVWLSAVLPNGYSMTGQSINGQINLSADDNGAIIANTTKALTTDGLNVWWQNEASASNASLSIDATMTYQANKSSYAVRKFYVSAQAVQWSGTILRSTAPQGKVIQLQFAGNMSAAAGISSQHLTSDGRLALAVDVAQLDRKALGLNLPTFRLPGPLIFDTTFALENTSSSLDFSHLQMKLTQGQTIDQSPIVLASVTALQKISIPLVLSGQPMQLKPAAPKMDGDFASVQVNAVPLSFIQTFLPENVKLVGDVTKGNIVVTGLGAGQSGLAWHAEQPLTVTNLSYSQDGYTKLSGVTVALSPNGTWHDEALSDALHFQASSSQGILFEGTFNTNLTKDKFTAALTSDGRLGALAAQPLGLDWRASLPDPKPEYEISANISSTDQALIIESGTVRVMPSSGVGASIGEVRLIQPVVLNVIPATTKTPAKYAWPQAQGDLLSIKTADLPAGVLGLVLPWYQLDGQGVTADIMVHGEGHGDFTVSSAAPFTAANLTMQLVQPSQPASSWLRDLTFTMRPTVKFNELGVTYVSTQDFKLTTSEATLGQGGIELTFVHGQSWPQQAKINLTADLGQLFKQPVLAKYNNLTNGRLAFDGEFSQDGTLQLSANASGWVVRSPSVTVPEMSIVKATGKISRDGQGHFAVQLNLPLKGQSSAGVTDCTAVFSLTPAGAESKFAVSLTGNSVVADDLMLLASACQPPAPTEFRPPGAPAPSTPAAPVASTAPDALPFWNGFSGEAHAQVAHIIFNAHSVENFQADALVSATSATLTKGSFLFEGAPTQVSGSLAFDAKQAPQPYQAQAKFAMSNFDTGVYFRKRNPQSTPPVEGKFSVQGDADGRGANLADIVARVPFNFKLTSSSGTFHLLDLVKKDSTGALAVGVGQTAARISQSIFGTKPSNSMADALAKMNQVITSLSDVQYNQLILVAQRGADANVKITQFDVRNPTVDLVGTGQITYQPGVALPDQPLSATLQLNVLGNAADILKTFGLLSASSGAGYLPGPQFIVSGTLQNPDYSSLFGIFQKAAGNAATRAIQQVLPGVL